MKFSFIVAATALVGVTAFANVSMAATKDYGLICNSARLVASDRAECRKQMEAATTDADRAKVYRVFDLKIAGFNPDGTRIKR